ncbi:hypothetical protein pdam_00015122, partial [Pocillopora damicornis]
KTYLSHYLIRADHQAVITINSHSYKLCRVLCYISFIEARSQGSSDLVSPFVRSFFAVMYRLSLVLVCVYIAVSVMLLTCPRDTEASALTPYGKRSQVFRYKRSICQAARALRCDSEENPMRRDLGADDI